MTAAVLLVELQAAGCVLTIVDVVLSAVKCRPVWVILLAVLHHS